KAWNGAGGEDIQHAHSWGRYVPPALFAEHPEFFAVGKDGERRGGGWLCTSNPDLRKHFADRVSAAIAAGQRNPSLSPTDGTGYCQCPACKAQDDPNVVEPSTGLVSVSRRYADFFDAVARQVGAAHPRSILSFYCYADYTQPPAPGRRLAPNLCAFIAPIRYCRLHAIGDPRCPSRTQEVAMIEGWAALAGHIGYYNYMYNLADATLPFFKFSALKHDIPYLKARGLTALTMEVLTNWHIYGPHIYLGVRLAYDPAADAGAVMEDYWQKFYGPAAPHMKAYWMGLDEAVGRLPCHAGSFFGLAQVYTPEFIAECRGRLAKAAEAARADKTLAGRVALAADGLQNAADYRAMCEAMSRADFAGARAVYDRMIARIQALTAQGAANREYGTAYLERFIAKVLAAGQAAAAPPRRVLAVLPDAWRFAHDEDGQGLQRRWHEPDFDDSAWTRASTWQKPLDAQGLHKTGVLWYRARLDVPARQGRAALFFAEVDGWSEVYVNGRKAAAPAVERRSPLPPEREGQAPPRTPFEVDVADAVRTGPNVVAVRVDHAKITELFLGGIIRPVVLVEKPQ
ncbi:MAG: DUF4838 domain-containing protein, partial [Planctomycetes bacterium]|nr:DUF4838 domain-containing protein [Planctomycetota bacterium]